MSTEEEAAKAAADAAAKPVTMAELTALLNDHNTKTNAAFAEHGKRLKKDFEKQLAALKPKPVEGEEAVEGDGGGDQPKPKPTTAVTAEPKKPEATQPSPEVEALRKELASMRRKQEQAEQQAKAEARRRVESEGYASLKTALSGKVAQGAEEVVLSTLRGRNAVIIGDDGAVRLRLGVKDEPEEGHDVTEGIAHLLKMPEAKFFLPPPNSGASAAKKPTGPTPTLPVRQSGSTPDPESAFESKFGKPLSDVL